MKKILKYFFLTLFTLVCINTSSFAKNNTLKLKDSFPETNRAVFDYTFKITRNYLDPVAKTYKENRNETLHIGFKNFFDNLDEPLNAINNFLQADISDTGSSIFRFVTNSTIGLLGFVDVATYIGVEEKPEDFGQTLAVWGVPSGSYIFIPLLGPDTVRGFIGWMVDIAINPVSHYLWDKADAIKDASDRANARIFATLFSGFISYSDIFEIYDNIFTTSLDPYEAIKSYYEQNLVYRINEDGEEKTKSHKEELEINSSSPDPAETNSDEEFGFDFDMEEEAEPSENASFDFDMEDYDE